MKLSIGVILKLAGEIEAILASDGLLDSNGDFITPLSPVAVSKSAAAIEALLVSKGVVVQNNVDKIIQLIPLILSLAGVK